MTKHAIIEKYANLSEKEEDELIKNHGFSRVIDESSELYSWMDKLYQADENCKHLTRCASGGGIECVKCGGWFCL